MDRATLNRGDGLPEASEEAQHIGVLRKIILALLVLEMLGTAAELILLDHFEDVWQMAPLVLIAAGFVVLAWHSFDRRASSLQALRVVMALAVASAGIGFYLHYRANAEFQLDIDPSMRGLTLWLKVMQAKAPPALAPGVMAHFGLLGLAYTYRHPALDAGVKDDSGLH